MRNAKWWMALGALWLGMGCGGPQDPGAPVDRSSAALAYPNVVTFTGQGLVADGFGGYDLGTELCGVTNGAAVEGPYLLWVLTASAAAHADIAGPWGVAGMVQSGGGSFKYVSGWFDPAMLIGNVSASYDGSPRNVQLVLSHGCRPTAIGGWCSPGFWRNARPGAWARIGVDPTSTRFNATVYDDWFGAALAGDPTLRTVLDNPRIYSGRPVPGTGVECPLNAFNATGAYLTNLVSGVQFDCDVMLADDGEACPLDSFGNFKSE
jgi:hypothetical protein